MRAPRVDIQSIQGAAMAGLAQAEAWMPRGQTPAPQYHFNWKVMSAGAGIAWWNFYFRLYPVALKATQATNFLDACGGTAGLAAGGPGRVAGASLAAGRRLHPRAARPARGPMAAGLRPGTQSPRSTSGAAGSIANCSTSAPAILPNSAFTRAALSAAANSLARPFRRQPKLSL